MKILKPGHIYELKDVDGPGCQVIGFVRRRGECGELLPPEERHQGILSQELIRVLIDRVRYLADEDPCVEDVAIIGHLRDTLKLFEARAARRTIEKMSMVETRTGCPVCHHLLCDHDHGHDERLIHEVRR